MKYKIKNNNDYNILDFIGEMFIRTIMFFIGPIALLAPFFTEWKNDSPGISLFITIIWLAVEYKIAELSSMVEKIKEEETTDNKEVEEYLKKWSKQS